MIAPSLRQDKDSGLNNMEDQEPLIAFPCLFALQLAKTPDNLAIIFEEQKYSYQDLDTLSDSFQKALENTTNNLIRNAYDDISNNSQSNRYQSKSAQRNIGICIDKSPEAIAAMLGILKMGAAFVPLDPEYPVERIAYMIQDANIKTIIAQPKHQYKLEPLLNSINHSTPDQVHWVDCYKPNDHAIDGENKNKTSSQAINIKAHDLAYIMYTSGSTGQPKGVQIDHVALATYCYADIEVYKVHESDRTLQFSTINFDIAIEEIFPPLLTGSCIVIRPSKRSDSLIELSSIINNYHITAVHIATAYWHEWVDLMMAAKSSIPESLRLMVVTGEKVSTKHYQHWKKLCQQSKIRDVLWCNAYGPTEATVSASVYIPDENFSENNMPIGKPLKRYTAMIVDENYTNLPIGKTGQLLIGGPALARGYLNKPELTADVFINIPIDGKNQRMYKTGDLARWMPNGDIEFAGRIDHQLKLGSYRIEPGEIEVAINQYELVLESLVSYDEINGKKALVAYIATGKDTININSLDAFLKNNLPVYMIPSRFVLIADFPKTTNGKIDRKALPPPKSSQTASSSSYVAPRNELEEKLADIWEDVLRPPKAGIHDDFFALGGSSLLAVGVVSRLITELDLELPVRDFFANPTIASQAKHIHKMLQAKNIKLDLSYDNIDGEDDSQKLRDRLPIIEPAFFKESDKPSQKDHRLYGIHYRPPIIRESELQNHAVLICHPLGHEYVRSYRNLQQLAILLAQSGFDVLRFDYYGSGNSEGKSEQMTAEQCINDIKTAATYVRKQSQCKKLSLLAVRIGVPLSLQAQLDDIENLIAWDPVTKGRHYIELLEDFHQKSHTGLRRHRQIRRNIQKKQLFGHPYSDKKYTSLQRLKMEIIAQDTALDNSVKQHHLITSSGYLEKENNLSQKQAEWHHHSTDDDIHWHSFEYTESAFSSPQAFQAIMQIMKNKADKS